MIPPKYQDIWNLVKPLMATVKKKDYVLHVEMVTRGMQEIIAGESGDEDILIPAAILHDVGWSEIPEELQIATDKESKNKAGHLHIENAPHIIQKLLSDLSYPQEKIDKIIDLVSAHKYQTPTEKDKQMLIDADNLSDTYSESFWSDIQSYHTNPQEALDFRSHNTFYTQTAKSIFDSQLAQRKTEILNGKHE